MNKGDDAKFNVVKIGAVNMGEIGAVTIRSCSGTGPHDSGAAMRTFTSLIRCPIDVATRRTPRGRDATTGNYLCSTTLCATHYVGCMYNIIINNNNNTPHVVSSTYGRTTRVGTDPY